MHKFIEDWVDYHVDTFSTMYPFLNKKKLSKFLNKIADDRVDNPKALLHNNYTNKSINVDLLSLVDWIDKVDPICGGFGVFFMDQNKALNAAGVMLDNFLKLRKSYKGTMKQYPEDSYEYSYYDRIQGTEKVNANSYYGSSGNETSNFFNIFTATSVTATGQSLISTTETAFEAFLANNVLFMDLNDCIFFIKSVTKEKKKLDDKFLPNVSIEVLLDKLKNNFAEFKPEYEEVLFMYLMNLHQRDLNRIFFKNNIYGFSKLRKIRGKLDTIFEKVDEFRNPNKVPECIKLNIEDLWDYYKEFVFWNNFAFNRIQRLKNDTRKIVVVVDTDSNMLNLNPWVEFIDENVVSVNDKILEKDPTELNYISINVMCYVLTNMISEVLWKYTKKAGCLKDYRPKINMKNEFLFSRLILGPKKKRYISSVKLREGDAFNPEKMDLKGLDFMKSTTREETKEYFTRIVKDRILYEENINIPDILRDLERFEDIIRKSLEKGQKNFLLPKSPKELDAYKDPYKEQSIRSILVWNAIYPEMTITLPEKIDMVKVTLNRESELERLKKIDRNVYDSIVEKIHNNKNEKISKKGVDVIGLPRNLKEIPEWMISFIDYDTIINDNICKFYPVLEALGLEIIKTSKKDYFSNILKV